MKFTIEHKFIGKPVKDAIEFLTEEYVFDPQKLQNVKDNKTIEESITPEKKHWKNQWCAHGQIPKLVQHIISPKMLTWIEETTYDRKAKTYFTKITPFYFRNMFFCESRGSYVVKSDSEFVRRNDGVLDIKIPVFGRFIEEQIIAHLRQNFDQEYKETYRVIKEKFPA